jgi:hypothetical protein
MDRKPSNEHESGNQRSWIEIKNLESQFKAWLNLLNQYEAIESFFDDPIIKSNAEKSFQKFDIIDENADVETFDVEQQLFLEEYLDSSKKKLEKLKKNQLEEKIIELKF